MEKQRKLVRVTLVLILIGGGIAAYILVYPPARYPEERRGYIGLIASNLGLRLGHRHAETVQMS
jgi:hypothetical protein